MHPALAICEGSVLHVIHYVYLISKVCCPRPVTEPNASSDLLPSSGSSASLLLMVRALGHEEISVNMTNTCTKSGDSVTATLTVRASINPLQGAQKTTIVLQDGTISFDSSTACQVAVSNASITISTEKTDIQDDKDE